MGILMGQVFRKIMPVFLAVSLPFSASAFDWPRDLPTFEALMALHKCVKKDEDAALTRVATSFGEQSIVTKGARKFNDVRTTLDTKLNNAYSYVVLAGAISATASSLYQLVNEYSSFTSNTFKYVSKNRSWRGIIPRQTSPYHARSSTATTSMRRWRAPESI